MTEERLTVRPVFTGGCRRGMPMVLDAEPGKPPRVVSAPLRTEAEARAEREPKL
jgi:hypothetical protein